MSQSRILLDELSLPLIRRKGRKHLAIEITPNGAVVRAPLKLALTEIQAFAKQKENWIRQQLALLPQSLTVADGMPCRFNGVACTLQLVPARAKSGINQNRIQLAVPQSKKNNEVYLRKKLTHWYNLQCYQQLSDMVAQLKPAVGYADQAISIQVRDYKKRWGSCDAKGELRFNWRLAQAPLTIQRYVVCHELAHLLEFNHSPRFWHIVELLEPDWQCARQWLNQNGADLYRW